MTTFTREVEKKLSQLDAEDLAGAVSCYHLALDCLLAFCNAEPTGEFREALLGLALRIAQSKPAMPALKNACDTCLKAIDHALQTGEDPLASMKTTLQQLRDTQKTAINVIATKINALISPGIRVMTYSGSATVHAALLGLKEVHVAITEGRPRLEGIRFAEALAAEQIPVTMGTDAAALELVATCQAVLVGADAVGDDWVVNKSGTLALALGARHFGIPFYVLADQTKLSTECPKLTSGPSADIYNGVAQLKTVNPIFELIPRTLITELVMN